MLNLSLFFYKIGGYMKKLILSLVASLAIVFGFIIPTTIVNAAEFISIGTGGPTGV